jgi:chromosome transmission fidelity protein 1
MTALTNWDADGRIIIEPAANKPPAGQRSQQQQQRQQQVAGAGPAASAAGEAGEDEVDLPLAAADDLDALGVSSVGGVPASAAAGAGPGAGSAGGGSQPPRSGRYSFVLLNAARHFQQVLSAARSVVLVSGTLAPVHSLRAQLLPSVAPERVTHFECGHVIAQDQLLALSIGTGPSGRPLDLRHSNRGKVELMNDAGAVLLNLAGVVPGGMVVFVGSFAYLEQLWGRWEHTGLLQRLGKKKTVFR